MRPPDETHLLTYEERAVFGTCPVCGAHPGVFCNPDVGLSLGLTSEGKPPHHGTHIGRLEAAPTSKNVYYGDAL